MNSKLMQVATPQVLWHGGGLDHGKPDPVYSIDFHPIESVLLTTGIDASVPPRGSVRLWKIDADVERESFLVEFADHQSVINVARFSPCGTMIASASEKQVIIYKILDPFKWEEVSDLKQVERKRITPSLNDIVDLKWSPDSSYIIIGALEQKPEIIRVVSKDKQRDNSVTLPSHGNYVQGVAWDPLNKFVATQSADRSVRVHKLLHRENAMVKLAQNGHSTIKMLSQQQTPPADEGWQAVEEAEKEAEAAKKRVPGVNLFADSNVPSSFRRLAFSPDGLLLITPTGVYRPPSSSSSQRPQSAGGKAAPTVFCTHIFVRDHFDLPAVSLVGLEDPSVAVRCCPRLFKPMPKDKEGKDGPAGPSSSLFSAPYRIIFAVATITSLLLYDSQHAFPLAKLKGLHYAPINDAAWSADGRVLAVCSSDGYLTFVRFKIGALGEPLEEELVPEAVKLSQTARYGRPAPAATEQKERAEGEAEGERDQAEEDRKRKLGEAEASPEKRAKVDNEEEEEV